ncbi:MAG: DUF5132 domain-containing protein [Thermodesulfobacteriota bacterium]
MGLLENVTKNKVLTGLAIGVGASILLPKLLPVLAESARPLIKGLLKSGVLCFEKGKEMIAEVGESTEDLWAEIKMELEEEQFADLEGEIAEVEEAIGGAEG